MTADDTAPRQHPFGGAGNALVHAGATLAMIQAVVVTGAMATAPLRGDVELTGVGLLAFMLGVVGIGYVGGWLPYRVLRRWRDRSTAVLAPLAGTGLALMPLGLLLVEFGAVLFSLAGLLLSLGAVAARRRVADAARQGRGSAQP